MKTTIPLFTCLLALFILSSCSKGGGSATPTPPTPTNNELLVTFSKNEIAADGFDEAIIKVKDLNNADVTGSATIYVNDVQISSSVFYTNQAGSYSIKAISGSKQSTIATIKAVVPSASPFTQKVLAEAFSGTWCGICPGTIIPLENYTNTNPNVISVGVHGPNGSSDPFQYVFDSQLRSTYSVSGVPTVLLNRDIKWNNTNSQLIQLAQQKAPLGLAFETSVNGSTIIVKTKVKFDVSTSIPLKLIVMLVEDGILYNQANYGHFGLPNPIPNFRHKNILRVAATDIFGDAIPVSAQVKGTTWEKSVSLNAGAYNIANSFIVATVIYGTNSQNRKGTLNTQIVAAGQNKDFD